MTQHMSQQNTLSTFTLVDHTHATQDKGGKDILKSGTLYATQLVYLYREPTLRYTVPVCIVSHDQIVSGSRLLTDTLANTLPGLYQRSLSSCH